MGSLSSRPSVPSTPQIVYVPQPTVASPSSNSGSSAANTASEISSTEAAVENAVAEQRKENLLQSSRGRGGTVLTSFRGLVESLNNRQDRKTLLGE